MSSTNKTTYYDLSQYTANDKPTYLGDYNSDMGKIDAGIREVAVSSGENATNIGTLTDLTTESKATLVGAINEVDSHTDTNTGDISTLNIAVAGNTTHIGDLTNLNTTVKTDLVSAINEVDSFSKDLEDYLMLTDYRTLSNPQLLDYNLNPITGSVGGNLRVALNNDGTFGKIYGDLIISNAGGSYPIVKFINTGIMGVTEEILISTAGISNSSNGLSFCNISIVPPTAGQTSASILIRSNLGDANQTMLTFPCLYYFKNFGDVQ